jgi:hypothetical protein
VEAKASIVERLEEQTEELAPEQTAQDPDRQEEVGRRRDPPGSIGRQPTSRHHTVDVGMMREGLTPGMKNRQEPDLGSEVTRVGRHVEQGP